MTALTSAPGGPPEPAGKAVGPLAPVGTITPPSTAAPVPFGATPPAAERCPMLIPAPPPPHETCLDLSLMINVVCLKKAIVLNSYELHTDLH